LLLYKKFLDDKLITSILFFLIFRFTSLVLVMSNMKFSQRTFTPKPPLKGSFPLDHDGECKVEMLEYLICMKENKSDNSKCRLGAKNYLNCRIKTKLMDRQDLEVFGFQEEKK
jgi:cytochrome c oxidase assembly protein subunit 19